MKIYLIVLFYDPPLFPVYRGLPLPNLFREGLAKGKRRVKIIFYKQISAFHNRQKSLI